MTTRTKALTKAQLDYALKRLRLYHKKAVEEFVADKTEEHGYDKDPLAIRGTKQALLSRMRGGKVTLTVKPEWVENAKLNPLVAFRWENLSEVFVECDEKGGVSLRSLVAENHKDELDELNSRFKRAEEELYLGDQAQALALLRELAGEEDL